METKVLWHICRKSNIIRILETGVANGWSTYLFYLPYEKIIEKLTSIDLPYPYKNSQNYIGSAIPEILKKKWNLILGIDYDILKKLNNNKLKFDLVHYDSDKNYFQKLNPLV